MKNSGKVLTTTLWVLLVLGLLGSAPISQQAQDISSANNTKVASSVSETDPLPPFDEWLQEAEILLYEEIAGDYARDRWIVLALENLGLAYFDTVDAKGNFHYELTGSKVWDLVIYAREDRTNQSGNLFIDVLAQYDNGASVILEMWDLDDDFENSWALRQFFEDCGIDVRGDLTGNPEMVLYSHNREHPIHNQPTSAIRMTAHNRQDDEMWRDDLGDLIEIEKEGNAVILYGISQAYDQTNGTVTSCFDNRFILQTHATHQFRQLRSVHLWENYIYNALYARYEYLLNQ